MVRLKPHASPLITFVAQLPFRKKLRSCSMLKSTITLSPAQLDPKFLAGVQEFQDAFMVLERDIPADLAPVKGDEFHQRTLKAFNESFSVCSAYEDKLENDVPFLRQVQEYFRRETDPWMRQSWIGDRARSKPSGFAGDYEMLIKLYEEKTPALGLGGYIDLCILDLPLARAVRSRLEAVKSYLLDKIKNRGTGLRILDIASGPCREYNTWPELPADKPVEVVAIDNDPIAIAYVEQQVAAKLKGSTRLSVARYNAMRTRNAKATVEKFGRFDIIYSVGLFDYLTDDHLIGMFVGLRDSLNDNGSLYIAFKDREQYSKTPYQWHLDWFFYQRTEQHVLDLYRQAGFDVDAIRTTRDATGIIINFISQHRSSAIQRLDSAEVVAGRTKTPVPAHAQQSI
jgi:SAM-dependent methyltransferase